MKESSSTSAPPASDAPTAPTTKDGQDLAELLRSMTTTTTIEKFDESTKTEVPSIDAVLPPENSSKHEQAGPYLPHPISIPTSITRSYKVFGVPTHAFCQIFSDRIVLGVTQMRTKPASKDEEPKSSGHIGSWVYCQTSRSPIDPRKVDYELSTLLGGATASGVREEKEIFARRISERLLEKKVIPGGSERIVLLLGISLLPITLSTSKSISAIDRFKVLVEALVELIEEALGIALE